jgi:uncharacterized membrane protein
MLMFNLGALWETLRASLWFIPSLLVFSAIALAIGLVDLDARLNTDRLSAVGPRMFGAGAEGSREMLSVIASSMITVAGVAFSITIVALSLASSQYTSRILHNFMRDRANQAVLGTFVGIYVYCLVVLRTIRGVEEGDFVPSLAVLFGIALALLGIGCLIFFIHHIASSIQAESIIKSAADETARAIDRLFPADIGRPDDEEVSCDPKWELAGQNWKVIPALQSGFLQYIDSENILAFARKHKAIVRMERSIGDFVIEGAPLVAIAGADGSVTEDRIRELNGIYIVGRQRTTVQDAGFGIRQIVDVALKALSPGVNDTTTAVTCIHYLSALMTRLATRRFESPYRIENGELRVVARSSTFPMLLGEAFDQIRMSADGNVAVLSALLQGMTTISEQTEAPLRRQALKRQVDLLASATRRSVLESADCEAIEAALQRFANSLTERNQQDALLSPTLNELTSGYTR